MKRASCAIVLASVLFAASVALSAQGQGGAAQQPNGFTNLQVWPTDTPRAVILNFMNAFNRSLGIECAYCHVQRDGRFDFASDEKREKRVARLLDDQLDFAGLGNRAVPGSHAATVAVSTQHAARSTQHAESSSFRAQSRNLLAAACGGGANGDDSSER